MRVATVSKESLDYCGFMNSVITFCLWTPQTDVALKRHLLVASMINHLHSVRCRFLAPALPSAPPSPSISLFLRCCHGAAQTEQPPEPRLPKTHSLFESLRLSSLDRESSSEHRGLAQPTVSLFWDLDNKPPKVRPYDVAQKLRSVAGTFGEVVDMVAYANRHAFSYVPQCVRDERKERKVLDTLERKGVVVPAEPYVCGLCGRKCKTNLALKKHFKQLHQRERQKRVTRLNMLKGKRKMKFKERISDKEGRYLEASKNLVIPKVGYGLASELRRAGVYVRTVKDKPQAADIALKERIARSFRRGLDCLCLVSDDTDFADVLRTARARNFKTVVVGETHALKTYADVWFSWEDLAFGSLQITAVDSLRQLAETKNLGQDSHKEFQNVFVPEVEDVWTRSYGQLSSNNNFVDNFGSLKESEGNASDGNDPVSAFSESEEELREGQYWEEGEEYWEEDDSADDIENH